MKLKKYDRKFLNSIREKIIFLPAYVTCNQYGSVRCFPLNKKPRIYEYFEGLDWTDQDHNGGNFVGKAQCKYWKKSLRLIK